MADFTPAAGALAAPLLRQGRGCGLVGLGATIDYTAMHWCHFIWSFYLEPKPDPPQISLLYVPVQDV